MFAKVTDSMSAQITNMHVAIAKAGSILSLQWLKMGSFRLTKALGGIRSPHLACTYFLHVSY